MPITELIIRIISQRKAGEEPNISELCAGDPELKDEVLRQLECIQSIDQLFESTTKSHTNMQVRQSESLPQSTPPPTKIDRYEIKRLLGQGGFGQVWLAHDPDLRRDVAIKIPRPDHHFSPEQFELVIGEARKGAALDSHPNIVKVLDVQRRGATCYIVSEHIDGMSLAERIKQGPLSIQESIEIVASVAEALHYAHLRDLVHRDVKPANILLSKSGRAYLSDFGLAVSEEEQLDEVGSVRGTIAFMAPEQARGESNLVDSRTDIYSLGVVLFHLLTNRLPYKASTTEEYLEQICHREAKPPRTIVEGISPELEQICLKCLEKLRKDRYTTARDLATALRACQDSPVKAKARRQRSVVTLLLLLGLLGIVVLAFSATGAFNHNQSFSSNPGDQGTRPKSRIAQNGLIENVQGFKLSRDGFSFPVWPGKKSSSFCRVTDDGKVIDMSVSNNGLLELGNCQENAQLELTLFQREWYGRVGIFLGLRPDDQKPETGRRRFHCFWIKRLPNNQHIVHLTHNNFRPSTSYLVNTFGRNHVPIDTPFHNLNVSLTIKQQKLTSLKIGNEHIPLQEFAAQSGEWVLDGKGGFGACFDQAAVRISNCKVNGKPVLFRANGENN